MIELSLAITGLAFAAVPAGLMMRNLRDYRRTPRTSPRLAPPAVSVLIPARDEERSITACIGSVLANRDVDLEVIVLNDDSTDQTADLVRRVAARDGRVRLESAPPLPEGWCGKQHACHHLARLASHELLLFLDADVRLAPDAVARAVAFLEQSEADLVSGIPRQITGTTLERLLIPLIHFILLGFLPLSRMRRSTHPAYGAGCGQLFLARRSAYERAGGHAAIRRSMHDGVTLPRAFRAATFKTDLFDATDLADCRMYRGAGEVWRGLGKNAIEGLASPAGIVPWTIMLGLGQLLPAVLLVIGLLKWNGAASSRAATAMAAGALLLTIATRLAAACRFRQSLVGAIFHPLGILLLLAIQWQALFRHLTGRPATWRSRRYASTDRFPMSAAGDSG